MEVGLLGIGEKRIRPPDLSQHLVADAQLLFAGLGEIQSRIGPVLPEIEIQREVLSHEKRPL